MYIEVKNTVTDFSGDIFNHMKSSIRNKIKLTQGFVLIHNKSVALMWDRDGSLHDRHKFLHTDFEEITEDIETVDIEKIKDKYIVIRMDD